MADGPQYWEADPNTVMAGPATGSAAGPVGARALTSADISAGLASANVVVGAAAGYKVARGTASVTGSSAINTGLASIVSFVLSLARAASSGTCWVSHSALASTGYTLAQVWALTSSGDATPVVSSVAATIHWIAVGT